MKQIFNFLNKKKKDISMFEKKCSLKKRFIPLFKESKKKARLISVKLYGGLVLAVIFILLMSLFHWRSLLGMAGIQRGLVQDNIPALVLMGSLVQESEKLIQSAPQLMAGQDSKDFVQSAEKIKQDSSNLKLLIDRVEQSKVFKNSLDIRAKINQMINNLDLIETSVSQKKEYEDALEKASLQIADLSRKIYKILVIEIDNRTFDLAIQSQIEEEGRTKRITAKDILSYRRLLNLQAQSGIAANLLREVLSLSDGGLIQPARERFLASISACEEALKGFHHAELKNSMELLNRAGLGGEDFLGVFELKNNILEIEKNQNEYLRQNKIISSELSLAVTEFHKNIEQGGSRINQLFEKSLKQNYIVLILINAGVLVGAFILAFFFIGPLIRRLSYLSKKMKNMSEGGIQDSVKIEGSDEVTEMASALEVFRKNALEVQRLGVVEKLAEQVKEKNKTLQETIEDLNKTRGQLVIQEKLASLGQLTSGIAHEIKNPLNFINNFSDLSVSLVSDLKKELESSKEEGSSLEFAQELLKDIQSNMEKISSHGKRINDIVTGMLEHSRGKSGSFEPVNINKYLDTYSNLAFHSKRSLNSSFNVVFEKHYDENVTTVKAVPQDISRMILNIMTNACDAIEEKINKSSEEFKGLIKIETKKEEGNIVIVIQDNGVGVPQHIKEKIFNPFFTTKATGQGTGLGLSLVYDIASKYGGNVSLESEEGRGAKFVISLPADTKP